MKSSSNLSFVSSEANCGVVCPPEVYALTELDVATVVLAKIRT